MIAMPPKKDRTGKSGPKRPNRSGVALGCYIDADIRQQMDVFIAEHNQSDEHPASVRSTVEAALKMYLRAKGFYPPKSSD
ncbi:MAG: hypothetical protein JWO38_1251 [Gemmataceae bacterium]|nr:hypothetical protein [Gemmataceae bacterium]